MTLLFTSTKAVGGLAVCADTSGLKFTIPYVTMSNEWRLASVLHRYKAIQIFEVLVKLFLGHTSMYATFFICFMMALAFQPMVM